MVTAAEAPVVQRVLQAAALTYVAATLTTLWMRLYGYICTALLRKSRAQ
jgi:Zn-dependent membrane protease YugP